MAASKVDLTYPKLEGHENDGDINWCKYVCGFPNPRTFSPEYKAWRNAMKRQMEQDKIPGWKKCTASQWAGIQAHALTIAPVSRRAALWEANSNRGGRFTECRDFLLKDIAKKYQDPLRDLLRVQPVPAVGNPVAIGNDRKLPQSVSIEYISHILI